MRFCNAIARPKLSRSIPRTQPKGCMKMPKDCRKPILIRMMKPPAAMTSRGLRRQLPASGGMDARVLMALPGLEYEKLAADEFRMRDVHQVGQAPDQQFFVVVEFIIGVGNLPQAA